MGSVEYGYDNNGNLISHGSRQYFYDAENQLIKVTAGAVTVAEYEYSSEGFRTKKIANGRTEVYYYNGGKLAYITDGYTFFKFHFSILI